MPLPTALRTARARKAQHYPQTVVRELATLEAQLGGREALVGLLSLAPMTADLRYVLGKLGDPLYQSRTLADICATGNLLPGDLLKQLAAGALLKGQVRAAQVIGQRVPLVVEDVLRRAAPYEDPCYTCRGTGTVTPEPTPEVPNPGPGPCETCEGSGTLRYQPELERQKVALDLARLLPKGGGLTIGVSQTLQAGGGGGGDGDTGSYEAFQRDAERAIYGADVRLPDADADTAPVDGEVVSPAEEEDDAPG